MAKKRMVNNQIVDSDDFLDMPLSTQALYFHLLTRADDEGFTNSVKKIMRMIKASEDDLKILIGKRFVIMFESGVLVIKHWLIHNTIRQDRLIPTVHQEEKSQLIKKTNNAYTEAIEQPTDKCQHRLGLDKISIDKNNNIVEETSTIPYQKIISYLNQKIDTSYKATSKETQRLIKARYNQGFTLEDFYKVIDIKYDEWFKTDMAKFLRPSTLFGTKFESYLNQKTKSKAPKNNHEYVYDYSNVTLEEDEDVFAIGGKK